MARTATTGFTEAFVHTDPFYRGTYKATLRCGASGAGVANAVVTRTNLATNPSFETNATGWGGYQATISRVAGTFGSGSFVGQAVATVTGVGGFFRSFSAVAGTTYTTSLTGLRISGSRTYRLQFEFYNGAAYLGGASSMSQSFATATRVSWTFTAPAGTTVAYIVCYSVGSGSIGDTFQIDNVLIEASSSLLPYFDGTYVDAYNGYTLTNKSWSGTADASTSTTTFRPTVAHQVTQLRLGALTDFSFPYRFGGRFYLGFATVQRTATASGTGSSTATGLRSKSSIATASGTGTSSATGRLTPVRTATGSGTGSSTAVRLRTPVRTASASGAGASSVTRLVTRVRIGSASAGTGSSTVSRVISNRRTATGSGVGSSSLTRLVTRPRIASGGSSSGSSVVRVVTGIRTASASGTATSATLSGVLYIRTATASGTSASSADWVKSHIFRVPYTYNYPGGYFGGGDVANRLGRYNRSGVRGRNLYKLTNGEYTIVDQRDLGQVAKLWYGGRDHFLTDAEVEELTAAGFGDSIT